MIARIYVRAPRGAVRVPDPFSGPGEYVPDDGMWVQEHPYWRRRILKGELMEIPEDQVPKEGEPRQASPRSRKSDTGNQE